MLNSFEPSAHRDQTDPTMLVVKAEFSHNAFSDMLENDAFMRRFMCAFTQLAFRADRATTHMFLLYSQKLIAGFNVFAREPFSTAQIQALVDSKFTVGNRQFRLELGSLMPDGQSRARLEFAAEARFVVALSPFLEDILQIRNERQLDLPDPWQL